MEVSHFSQCRLDSDPAPLQAYNAILCGVQREHTGHPCFPSVLFLHMSVCSHRSFPYLTQLLSPARTTLDTRKTKDRSAFHSQPLEDRRFGFNLSRHQGFLLSLSRGRGSFSVTVPCHYFDHELLTGDERSQGRPTPRGESNPTLALTLLLEESKVGTVKIDFL